MNNRLSSINIESLKVAHEINKLPMINEEEILQLINKVKQYVFDRNIPECKKFISDFVKRVNVYRDHVEVIFNVAFCASKQIYSEKFIENLRTIMYNLRYSCRKLVIGQIC